MSPFPALTRHQHPRSAAGSLPHTCCPAPECQESPGREGEFLPLLPLALPTSEAACVSTDELARIPSMTSWASWPERSLVNDSPPAPHPALLSPHGGAGKGKNQGLNCPHGCTRAARHHGVHSAGWGSAWGEQEAAVGEAVAVCDERLLQRDAGDQAAALGREPRRRKRNQEVEFLNFEFYLWFISYE